MATTIIIRDLQSGEEETHTVTDWGRYHHPGRDGEDEETGFTIKGLQPGETDLLGSSLNWYSGSLGGPEIQRNDDGEPNFPSVYVPDTYGVTIDYYRPGTDPATDDSEAER